jgi:hypothetical protein
LFARTEALRPDLHRDWTLAPFDFAFAAGQQSAPITISEFATLCRHLPIVFVKAEDSLQPFALMGLRVGENLMLNDGRWLDGAAPLHLRRYPFMLLEVADDQLAMGIDPDFQAWIRFSPEKMPAGGFRLFAEDGQTPSAPVREIFSLLQAFQNDIAPTQEFCAALEAQGLLVEKVFEASCQETRLTMDGFFVVDEEKFSRLPAEVLADWQAKGWLKSVFAHLLSLEALRDLMRRLETRVAPATRPEGEA